MAFTRCGTTIGWILLSVVISGADLDRAVVSQMRLAVPGTDQVRVVARVQAAPELDVVVLLAGSRDWPPGQDQWLWWDTKRTLGIFLQRSDRAGTIYKIAIQKGLGDCEMRVERATGTDLVVSCRPEKENQRHHYKFLYDIRSKALTGQVDYQPFSMHRLFASDNSAVLVGSDGRKAGVLQFDALNDQIPFHLLSGSVAERWSVRANPTYARGGLGPTSGQMLDVPPRPFRTLRFGPDARFALVKNQSATPNTPGSGFTIIERLGNRTNAYPLPRTTYDEFARLRPGRVRDGHQRANTELAEEIGPAQITDGTLWIAKTFYDSEGNSGVGGFGFFDLRTKKYTVYSPPEVLDWSATAMLVEPEAAWIGLVYHGEYGDSSGGLIRFDRATETCLKIALPDFIYEMVRIGEDLVLATDFGAAVVRNGKVRRFFIGPNLRGQPLVSEALQAR